MGYTLKYLPAHTLYLVIVSTDTVTVSHGVNKEEHVIIPYTSSYQCYSKHHVDCKNVTMCVCEMCCSVRRSRQACGLKPYGSRLSHCLTPVCAPPRRMRVFRLMSDARDTCAKNRPSPAHRRPKVSLSAARTLCRTAGDPQATSSPPASCTAASRAVSCPAASVWCVAKVLDGKMPPRHGAVARHRVASPRIIMPPCRAA